VPMPSENVVYFEFDSTALNDAGRKVIAAYGRYLAANPSVRVRLEGHTDERGSREYNVGLGERRAVAVQQQLLSAGASARQLSVTSFGEERPAATGSNASAWAKNRRVEIVRQ
jgi:peptidoglycan-associated lipoprotein